MAVLTSAERKSMPASKFVFPKSRKFPIEDKVHARDALSRAGAKGGSVAEKVRAAVARKYPSIKQKAHHDPKIKTLSSLVRAA